LTKEESADYSKLRAKLDLHIKALEAELPKVTAEEAAKDKLNDLARSQILYGMNLVGGELKGLIHAAILNIKNDELRKKLNTGFEEFWAIFNTEHRKRLEKMREKALEKNMQNPEIRPTPPPPPEKNPPKPPAAAKDTF
ncbi:MAG TPA: hypothetical protein VKX17_15035, partial [Planctomycetota bacterium]|nr:hypothetical protein [Planctomycetota bacterium]